MSPRSLGGISRGETATIFPNVYELSGDFAGLSCMGRVRGGIGGFFSEGWPREYMSAVSLSVFVKSGDVSFETDEWIGSRSTSVYC